METNGSRSNAAAMIVFAEVVATGSFTRAARRLGLSKASVSREIARLERRLGAQLLRRTTRSMSLTEIGETFYAGCLRVAEASVTAKIFGVGGMLEKKMLADMEKSYVKSAAFTNQWLAEKNLAGS